MNKTFTQEDIRKWALFSGDHNRIHFDDEIAKKNGLNGIIVQGMLVLQGSKNLLSEKTEEPCRIKYFLKNPVYKNTDLFFQLSEDRRGTFMTVSENDNVCITGKAVVQHQPEKVRKAADQIFINDDFLHSQLSLFRESYPEINHNWMILDALLFSVCFKFQNGDPFFRKAQKITKEPDKSKVVTYQVDQDIFITKELLSYDFTNVGGLTFYYEDQDVIKEDYSVYSLLQYQVFDNDRLLYQSSMGSITKAARPE